MPVLIDLCCGLGGWAEGFLAEGWTVYGFDIERHVYGAHRYPGQLVIQDIRTLHGRQFARAGAIVASPPCQKYSYMAQPWGRAKALARWYRESAERRAQLNDLVNHCIRIHREACEAAGREIPFLLENVRGAQPWIGRAPYRFGSFYLWGSLCGHSLPPQPRRLKVGDKNRYRKGRGKSPHWTDPTEPGIKQHGSGRVWFDRGIASLPSHSPRRRAASALIAKIPIELSGHVARCWRTL